jgi:hypothetical protein
VAENNPTGAPAGNAQENADRPIGIPSSAVSDHPTTAIPLPEHGFENLDLSVQALATIPAAEVISRAAVTLMNAAAERLGLAPGREPDLDLDEARALIAALSGLLAAAQEYLGPHQQPLVDGLRTLQHAFREASAFPDPPGEGPGEKFMS